MKSDNDDKNKGLENAAIAGAAAETIDRYGSAAKEYFVAYSGVDNENGKVLSKGLKSIAESKVNPDYITQNTKQQAGFAAEVMESANTNAENIINGSGERKVRTDDIGRVNDQLEDHVLTDSNGNIISGSGSQMKFVGSSPEAAFDKLKSKDFDKYFENDTPIDVPYDYYDGIIEKADTNIKQLEAQEKKLRDSGKTELADKKQKEIERCKKIKQNVRKSTVSNDEALFARKHPKLATAGMETKTAHRAGMEQAKIGGAISGSISIVKNIVSLAKGEKEVDEAAADVIKNTGEGAIKGYTMTFSGPVLKGTMQNSKHELARTLSNTSLPGNIAATTLNIGRVMKKYISGEIDGTECIDELGKDGFGMLGASLMGAINVSLLPAGAPAIAGVLSGLAASMFGYAAAAAIYSELRNSLKQAKLAHEERLRIEAECQEAVQMIQQYRDQMNALAEKYLSDKYQLMGDCFDSMDSAIIKNDVNGFIGANSMIMEAFSKKPLFGNMDEFDSLMMSDNAITL